MNVKFCFAGPVIGQIEMSNMSHVTWAILGTLEKSWYQNNTLIISTMESGAGITTRDIMPVGALGHDSWELLPSGNCRPSRKCYCDLQEVTPGGLQNIKETL